MRITTEQLHAYLDGQLGPDDVARIAAALAADPELVRELEAQQRVRDRLRAAFDPVLEEPVPERLRAAASGTGSVVDLGRRRGTKAAASLQRRPWWPGLGMAAALALGIVIGPRLTPDDALIARADGALLARGELARVLSGSRSGEGLGDVVAGFGFRDDGGRLCRSFNLRQADAMAGLACRVESGWSIEVLAESEAAGGELRTASSALPPAVLEAIDSRIVGEPLDADGEASAIARDWR